MRVLVRGARSLCGSPVFSSAIIWAAVIAGTATVAPQSFARMLPIVGGGAAAHMVILGSAHWRQGRRG